MCSCQSAYGSSYLHRHRKAARIFVWTYDSFSARQSGHASLHGSAAIPAYGGVVVPGAPLRSGTGQHFWVQESKDVVATLLLLGQLLSTDCPEHDGKLSVYAAHTSGRRSVRGQGGCYIGGASHIICRGRHKEFRFRTSGPERVCVRPRVRGPASTHLAAATSRFPVGRPFEWIFVEPASTAVECQCQQESELRAPLCCFGWTSSRGSAGIYVLRIHLLQGVLPHLRNRLLCARADIHTDRSAARISAAALSRTTCRGTQR
mgnify:CR=1 FL=1